MYKHVIQCLSLSTMLALSLSACNKEPEPVAPLPQVTPPTASAPVTKPAMPAEMPATPAPDTAPAMSSDPAAPVALTQFSQEISSPVLIETMKVSEIVAMPVSVKNTSTETWPANGSPTGDRFVHLIYRWLDSAEKVTQAGRAALPANFAPGETTTLDLKVKAPNAPGDYTLLIGMVQEKVAFFDKKGAPGLEYKVSVTP